MKRLLPFFLLIPLASLACTSVIISRDKTASGAPLMLKHRDTKSLNNEVRYIDGEKYTFIGLFNSQATVKEIWCGMNEVGFCIINTASYNFKEDNIPSSEMDQEAKVMYAAAGSCKTVDDFEKLLTNRARPLGCETNFGVMDAQGGAAYFETNNDRFVRYDIKDMPNLYRVATNFSEAGRVKDRQGVERFLTATAIMKELSDANPDRLPIDAQWIFDHFSLSYRHEVLHTAEDYVSASGWAVDQDFIPRRLTSSSIIFQGVKPGQDPKHTIMWALLGYPACGVAIPLFVGPGKNILPSHVQKAAGQATCAYTQTSNYIKNTYVFPLTAGNGNKYFNIGLIQQGNENLPALKTCAQTAQKKINDLFLPLYNDWCEGKITDKEFYSSYEAQTPRYYAYYLQAFAPYIQ